MASVRAPLHMSIFASVSALAVGRLYVHGLALRCPNREIEIAAIWNRNGIARSENCRTPATSQSKSPLHLWRTNADIANESSRFEFASGLALKSLAIWSSKVLCMFFFHAPHDADSSCKGQPLKRIGSLGGYAWAPPSMSCLHYTTPSGTPTPPGLHRFTTQGKTSQSKSHTHHSDITFTTYSFRKHYWINSASIFSRDDYQIFPEFLVINSPKTFSGYAGCGFTGASFVGSCLTLPYWKGLIPWKYFLVLPYEIFLQTPKN